ncbi:MAG TPA: Hsp20/alpha crystallin family protein [Chitinophagaceae bacterium]|nr:MAG: heat shock protein Hsp20 [Bacteroidetes bacterium OLB11]HMN33388.1 Hsp20/alpha crystallin family protein [Chitinophagaceae bacterium]
MTNIRVKHPAYVPSFFKAMDKFLNEDYSNLNSFTPSTNIIEKEASYTLQLSIPGISKEDIKIELDGDLLTIAYEKNEEKTDSNENYIKREFATSSFKRSFTVNDGLNLDDIRANFEKGILNIEIFKKQVKAKEVKTISIN